MKSTFSLLPEQATEFAAKIDLLYLFILAVNAFFIFLVVGMVIFFAVKYRRRSNSERPAPPHEDSRLEVASAALLGVLMAVMFVWGAKVFFEGNRPPKDAMEVLVVGKQWMWKLQHPEGKREINSLHIPVGQAIKLNMTSEDVIHSFYIPAFRVKNDVLPGRYTTVWFKPTKEGRYNLFCTEYCGTEHSRMVGWVDVMSESGYEEWLRSSGSASSAQETPVQAGARLFSEFGCATCHNSQSGALGPNLVGVYGTEQTIADGSKVMADENYLRESILNSQAKLVAGFAPIMPVFKGQISEEQLSQIIAYIKSLSKKEG
jgi:cytochrome c oxidase subunit 2